MKINDGMKLVGDDWHYFLDGQKVSEKKYRKRYPLPVSRPGDIVGGTPTRGWPMKSDHGFAVHPDQVDEANARNKEHGVNVQYVPGTGTAIIPDTAARKRLIKLEKFIDRDGFGL